VRVLVFHGYLLHGTGSNVYNARLAAALVRAGHEVHLLCQDRDPASLAWVDAVDAPAPGARATVYRPDIGDVLPVYVPDHYEGFDARPFYELSDEEVEAYVQANVDAVRAVPQCDVALANHLVMGPAVLARALGEDVPYAVKIHGSALEYVVKRDPRFVPYAREGLARARGILVGSRHTAESLWGVVPEARERTRLGPPGVDVGQFAPRDPGAAREGVERLARRLAEEAPPEAGDGFARDPRAAARALAEADGRLVVYVGKLIASKGVELLLAAWPVVLRAHPDARLLVVGFGAWRQALEGFAAGEPLTHAEDGRPLEGFDAPAVPLARVAFTGRLEHEELADLLPAAEALVAPSTFPEAFGMVAAEAAAAGALPVVARHSGLAEVSEALAERVPEPARPWLSFAVGEGAVEELAACLNGWLGAPEDVRAATREAIVAVTRERWSWDGVARTVVDAACGRVDALPRP
jgi:glycosyltransferase involved in cell wall biosynthesis